MTVNGQEVPVNHASSWTATPVVLKAGWYALQVEGTVVDGQLPAIRFGKARVLPLSAGRMWCLAE